MAITKLMTTRVLHLPTTPSRITTNMYSVGEAVNVLNGGDPYLAGYISKIERDFVFIKFPYGRFKNYEYKYELNKVLPYQTQSPGRAFRV